MRLKQTLFDDSPLPFALQYGHVGKIYIKLPIWDMFKSPLVIQIEDVFAFLQFKPVSQWNEKQQILAFQQGNQHFLDQFEIFMKQKALLQETQTQTACGFKEKLVARILDNLQISIKRVYFRFEDYILIKNTPFKNHSQNKDAQRQKFCIGLKLKEFSVQTVNKKYDKNLVINQDVQQENFLNDEQKLTYKVVQIQGLSFFCDWNNIDCKQNGGIDLLKLKDENKNISQNLANSYFIEILQTEFSENVILNERKNIINNFEAELRLQFNKDISNPLAPASLNYPQLQAIFIIGAQQKNDQQKQIQIFQPQILRILKTLEMIGFFNEFRDGALQDIMSRKLSNNEKEQYIDVYYQFKKIESKLEGKFTESNIYKIAYQKMKTELRSKMQEIEDLVESVQIIELRQQCLEKVRSEDGRAKQLDEIEQQIQKEISQQVGYGLFISKTQRNQIEAKVRLKYEQQINEVKLQYDDKDSLISENIKSLISEFRTEEDPKSSNPILEFDDLPQEYVFLSFSVLITNIQTSLFNEFDQNLFQASIQDLDFNFQMAKKFRKLKLYLKQFNIQDLWSKSIIWPYLAQTIQEENQENNKEQNKNEIQALKIYFEQNSDFKACPFDLKIITQKSCHIVLNVPLVNEIIRTMNKALQNEKLDFDYFLQLAIARVNELRMKAKKLADNLKKGEYQHQSIQIYSQIFAPVLFIPEDIFERNSRFLKLDLGQINIQSELQEFKQNKNYKQERSEELVYDNYKFELKSFSFKLIDYFDQSEQVNQIIKDVCYEIQIKNCLDPLHPTFPSLQILPSFNHPIKIEIPEGFQLFKILLDIKEKILVQVLNKDYHLVAYNIVSENQNQVEQIDAFIQNEQEQIKNDDYEQEAQIQNQIKLRRQATKLQKKSKIEDSLDEEEKQQIEIKEIQQQNVKNCSNIVIRINMDQVLIQFGTEGVASRDEINSGIIDKRKLKKFQIYQTDRFIFEMKSLFVALEVGQNQTEFRLDFGIQKLEVREALGQQEFQIESQGNKENMFRKIIFWKDNDISEDSIIDQQNNREDRINSRRQINCQVIIKLGFHNDEKFGDIIDQSFLINLQIKSTIFIINFDTLKRVIQSGEKIWDTVQFMNSNEQQTQKLVRHEMYHSLKKKDSKVDLQKSNYFNNLFQNLARMYSENKNDKELIFQNIIKILESDVDVHVLCRNAEKVGDIQIEDKNDDLLIQAFSQIAIQDENKRAIQEQETIKRKIEIKIQVQEIDLWLCNYQQQKKEEQNYAQILQFKFKTDFQLKFNWLLKKLYCAQIGKNEQKEQKIIFTAPTLEDCVKKLDRDDSIILKLFQIQIEQKMFDSWAEASNLLQKQDQSYIPCSNMLSPTDILISLNLKSQMNLDEHLYTEITFAPINISADYKDIHLLLRFKQIFDLTIEPDIQRFISKLDFKIDDMKEKLQNKFKEVFQQKKQFEFNDLDQNLEKPQEEIHIMLKKSESFFTRKYLNQSSPEYIASIQYKKGDLIFINHPEEFRKSIKVVYMKIGQIQIEFCDGQLEQYIQKKEQFIIPLILMKIKNFDLTMKQYKFDDEFDPLSGHKVEKVLYENIYRNTGSMQFTNENDHPSFIEIDSSLMLEATYFNQLTQNFEPFIEPWNLIAKVTQQEYDSLFKIEIDSNDLLNLNMTYGMAASIRNIQIEVKEVFRAVDQEIIGIKLLKNQAFEDIKKLKEIQNHKNQIRNENYINFQEQFNDLSEIADEDHIKTEDQTKEKKLNQKYNIINNTSMDLLIESSHKELRISRCDSDHQFPDFEKEKNQNQIQILCEQFDKDQLQPQTQDLQVNLDQLFQTQSDQNEIIQIEEDMKMVDLKIRSKLAQDYEDTFYFHNISIENNGVFSYQQKDEMKEEKKQTEKQLNLVINISSKGTKRTISFESQLVIINNTQYPVTLCFASRSFLSQQSQSQIQQTKEHYSYKFYYNLDSYNDFKVPLKWYLISEIQNQKQCIDMFVVKKMSDDNIKNDFKMRQELVFRDITRTFYGQFSGIDLEKINSKIIELNQDLYISFDVHGYRCMPEESKSTNPIQFLIELNPPLVISNKSMCPLQLYEIDFPNTKYQEIKLQSQIPAGMSDSLFQLDIQESNQSYFLFKFIQNRAMLPKSKVVYQIFKNLQKYGNQLLDKNLKEHILCEDFIRRDEELFSDDLNEQNDQDELIRMQIECTKRSNNLQSKHFLGGSYGTQSRQRDLVIDQSKAIQLAIYPKYFIVNKTSKHFSVNHQTIPSKHSDFLSLQENEHIINLKTQFYKPTFGIDLNQVGMSGVIKMDSENEQSKEQLQLGISISLAPAPFNKTIILTIVPRYLIVNKLKQSIAIRQTFDSECSNQLTQENIFVSQYESGKGNEHLTEEIHFHVQEEKTVNNVKLQAQNKISVRIVENVEDRMEWNGGYETNEWTLPFSVDQLDDFQTQLTEINDADHNPTWCLPSRSNNFRRIIRVIITPNQQDHDATLLIIIEQPAMEEFIIKNKTNLDFEIYKFQKSQKKILDDIPTMILAGQTLAYVWDFRDIIDKNILVKFRHKAGVCSLDQISQIDKKSNQLKTHTLFVQAIQIKHHNKELDEPPKKMKFFSSLKVNSLSQKILTIDSYNMLDHSSHHRKIEDQKLPEDNDNWQNDQTKNEEVKNQMNNNGIIEEEEDDEIFDDLKKEGIQFCINFKGMGISFIDNHPNELLYASISGVHFNFTSNKQSHQINNQQDKLIETKTEFYLSIQNIQIDNLTNEDMPVIFCRKILCQDLILNDKNYDQLTRLQRYFKMIDPIMAKKQENVLEKKKSFGCKKTQYGQKEETQQYQLPFISFNMVKKEKSYENKIGTIVRFDQIHFAMQEFCLQANTNAILNNINFALATSQLFSIQEESINFVSDISKQQFDQISTKTMDQICEYIDASKGILLNEDQINVKKLSFGVIMLGTIKMNLTLKLDRNKIQELNMIYGSSVAQLSSLIYYFGPFIQSFASVSDLVITLNELVFIESFITSDMLTQNILNHYKYQIQGQVFRIIGSSNLLGNPAGLLDKVGQAVYEMARDPMIGMKQGPRGFVSGIGSGMQGMVKGVVGGGFQSLSNMSGSLYSIVKTSTGQEDSRSTQKIENISQGIVAGAKGLGGELARGVAGLISNPIRGGYEGGFQGFFYGIGKGVAGALATPIVGVLRAGESVSQGIAVSATNIGNMGKSQIELLDPRIVRVRESRRIDLQGRISCYDEDLALVNFYINKLESVELQRQQIRLYDYLPSIDNNGKLLDSIINILIVTTDYLILLPALNFLDARQKKKFRNKILIFEKLSNILEYKIKTSPEYYYTQTINKQQELVKQESGFFFEFISIQQNNQRQKKQNQNDDALLENIEQNNDDQINENEMDEQEQISQQDEIEYKNQQIPQYFKFQKQKKILSGSLSEIAVKDLKKCKILKVYENILNFEKLVIQRINGIQQNNNSKIVQMYKTAQTSQSASINIENYKVESQINQVFSFKTQQSRKSTYSPDIKIIVTNPQNLLNKLDLIVNLNKKRTVLYSGNNLDVLTRLLSLLDQDAIDVRENVSIVRQLQIEAQNQKQKESITKITMAGQINAQYYVSNFLSGFNKKSK